MPENNRIIHTAVGINWRWYHVYELNNKHKEAHLINSWREHLYNPSRNIPMDKTGAKEYQIISGYAIKQWAKDGRPGGFNGCKDNYKKQPKII